MRKPPPVTPLSAPLTGTYFTAGEFDAEAMGFDAGIMGATSFSETSAGEIPEVDPAIFEC